MANWASRRSGRSRSRSIWPEQTPVVVEGSLSLRNHLAVREILRTNSDLREQYAAVKRRAGASAANIDEYGRGKNAMIQQLLAAARLTDATGLVDAAPSLVAHYLAQHSYLPPSGFIEAVRWAAPGYSG